MRRAILEMVPLGGITSYIDTRRTRGMVIDRFAQSHLCNIMIIIIILHLCCNVDAVNPNLQQDYNTLPGMQMWDGNPFHEFRRTWYAALIVALGSIFQEGWTLLQAARGSALNTRQCDAFAFWALWSAALTQVS